MATRIRFVDLYSLYDDIDADVIGNLLEGSDISCMVRQLETADDSVDDDSLGTEEGSIKMISVEEDGVEKAKKIIEEAIAGGIISGGGQFVA
ncbi:MAG: DUF2007 domain-containing protein [Thermodesulfobacteriota bacterium]